MKIKTEHFNQLKAQIQALPRDKVLAHKALELGNDKTRRYLWDIYSVVSRIDDFELQKNLYEYLNDTHIETALKKIIIELKL